MSLGVCFAYKPGLLSLTVFVFLSACTTAPKEPPAPEKPRPQDAVLLGEMGLPKEPDIIEPPTPPVTVVLDHKFFTVFYDPESRLPRYVKYTALAENLRGSKAKRKNKFKADPMVIELGFKPVRPSEYVKSGYDQGHMAPSADFAFSQQANDETFVMTNMVPQKPNLNRIAWRQLEDRVRKWVCAEERVIVITGPVIEKKLPTLKSGLPIPKEFFKIVIDDTKPKKVIAFLYKQSDKGNPYRERVTPVAVIEKKIGISFRGELPEPDNTVFDRGPSLSEWREGECAKSDVKRLRSR